MGMTMYTGNCSYHSAGNPEDISKWISMISSESLKTRSEISRFEFTRVTEKLGRC